MSGSENRDPDSICAGYAGNGRGLLLGIVRLDISLVIAEDVGYENSSSEAKLLSSNSFSSSTCSLPFPSFLGELSNVSGACCAMEDAKGGEDGSGLDIV